MKWLARIRKDPNSWVQYTRCSDHHRTYAPDQVLDGKTVQVSTQQSPLRKADIVLFFSKCIYIRNHSSKNKENKQKSLRSVNMRLPRFLHTAHTTASM